MIPLYSDKKLSRLPFATIILVFMNILVFWYQLTSPGSINQSVWLYGVIPHEVFNPGTLNISGRISVPLSFITGMFTHGGFVHLGSNILYLWVFGRNVEDDFGPVRYLLFYFGAGIISTIVFVIAFPSTKIPLVGASGAISGILGAYFLRFPLTKVHCLFIFIIFVKIIPVPAFLVLGLWLAIQFLACIANITAGAAGQGGVAWIAHIVGFVTGIIWTILILRRRYYLRRYE